MSVNLNSVIICGRLVRDPELKALPSGGQVTTLSIATNHVYTKDGEKKESVEYHNVVLFGKQAENTAKYLKKGDEALVMGRNQTRSWDKDGVKMYRTEIIADSIQFGSKAKVEAPKTTPATHPNMPDYPEEDINPEDIPFSTER